MDDAERDEILWRLDERTKKVDSEIDRLFETLNEHGEILDDHEERITDNEDDIDLTKKAAGSFGAAALAAITSFAAKVAGLIRL